MWTFGDGGYSHEKNPEWIFDVEGEYKVVLKVFGPDGLHVNFFCSYYCISQTVRPVLKLSPEKAVLPDDEIRFL